MAKKKQCQLAVLTLTEEKMSVWKTRDCSEAVLAMAMDGVFICAALSTEYVVYNMDKMSLTPLFPLDPAISRVPNILRIDRDEFLVLGPGNLGMFVTSAGVAGRPPLQWSAGVSHVTYAAPHLVCQGQEMVAVYDIGDQSIKQGLSYPGARFVGFYDGTLLLASSSTIDTLVAVPLAQQAEAMLESGHLEAAVRLARDTRAGDIVRQKAAFMFLKTGQLDRAQELLLGAAVAAMSSTGGGGGVAEGGLLAAVPRGHGLRARRGGAQLQLRPRVQLRAQQPPQPRVLLGEQLVLGAQLLVLLERLVAGLHDGLQLLPLLGPASLRRHPVPLLQLVLAGVRVGRGRGLRGRGGGQRRGQ